MAVHGLRSRRLAAGLSQDDLAALAGVSTSTIRNLEKDRVTEPRLGQRITDALDRYERGPSDWLPTLALVYVTDNGTRVQVDGDGWDPAGMAPRDRAICRALLKHALTKLDTEEPHD